MTQNKKEKKRRKEKNERKSKRKGGRRVIGGKRAGGQGRLRGKKNVIPRSECWAENGSNERDKGNPRQNRLNCNCNGGERMGRKNAGNTTCPVT